MTNQARMEPVERKEALMANPSPTSGQTPPLVSSVTLTKAHRIRLHPTPEQEDYLRRACGTRRFIYNWGLVEWQRQYQAFKAGQCADRPTADALKKQFNAIREAEFPWTYDDDQVCRRGRL